jgi:predicted nucleotidyltransferase
MAPAFASDGPRGAVQRPGGRQAVELGSGVSAGPLTPLERERVVAEIRRAVPSAIAVYVFGSVASGTATPSSDLDLAVLALAEAPLTAEARWQLAQTLAIELRCDVDLVDLRQASTVLRVQVLGSSQLLFDGDTAKREAFETVALGAYARLNEARRGILEDIRQRGRVFG